MVSEELDDLEEDGLAVATDGAAHRLGAGQRRVAGDVLEHLGELPGAVVHHVPVHAVVVCNLLQFSEHFSCYHRLTSELAVQGEKEKFVLRR